MTLQSTSVGPARLSPSLYMVLYLFFLVFAPLANTLAYPPQEPLGDDLSAVHNPLDSLDDLLDAANAGDSYATKPSSPFETQQHLLSALRVMQDEYFVLWMGTWPTSIDWTAAVLGTHVAATLSSLTSSASGFDKVQQLQETSFAALENTVNHFFSHTVTFYFGENAFSLRNQAYDDMLWVVLDWLENVKFQDLHSDLHYPSAASPNKNSGEGWYGTQFRNSAAHRARIFWELASAGWDKTLCNGGMIWNPTLVPYKNAITNELYISASIAMYLYFPGDPVDAPFVSNSAGTAPKKQNPHNVTHLKAAIDAYAWLKDSNMTGLYGLYADGFHISGWQGYLSPGSRKCDVLNTMVYTYNQGVVLSGLRGLWLATGSRSYLDDGHELISKILRATGWPQTSSNKWAGLGRGGVMEDTCDSGATCSQDGQTFKGIFFHHLTEFCRPLRPQEESFLAGEKAPDVVGDWNEVYIWHLRKCHAYGPWIEHNARAALMTRDDQGKFGMWWGLSFNRTAVSDETVNSSTLSAGAVDYINNGDTVDVDVLGPGVPRDFNDRGRGRTVETQSGGVAILRALLQWQTCDELS